MGQRLDLQTKLIAILGAENVYFQPPPTLQMSYPCIVYERDLIDTRYADNKPYTNKRRYQVTVIDRDPDSSIVENIARLPLCSYDRSFIADGLNHDVFNLFF